MEITLEMVEQLRKHADVSFSLARKALECSGGNVLDALIYLEETGAIPRTEDAYCSTRKPAAETALIPPPQPQQTQQEKKSRPRHGFFQTLRFWLIDNELEIWRKGKPITSLPVLILLLLLVFTYGFTIPLLIVGLFFGFRYRFSGPDLGRDSINNVMDTVADTAADVGRQVMDELHISQNKNDETQE